MEMQRKPSVYISIVLNGDHFTRWNYGLIVPVFSRPDENGLRANEKMRDLAQGENSGGFAKIRRRDANPYRSAAVSAVRRERNASSRSSVRFRGSSITRLSLASTSADVVLRSPPGEIHFSSRLLSPCCWADRVTSSLRRDDCAKDRRWRWKFTVRRCRR